MLSGILENPLTRLLIGLMIGSVVIGIFITLAPVFVIPEAYVIIITDLLISAYQFDFIFPVSLLFWCITSLLGLEFFFWSAYFLLFIYRLTIMDKV